jgi:two-component system OmpR family response regulator
VGSISAVAARPVILIAEDDPIVRELLQEVLELDLHADVRAAAGGVEMLRLLDGLDERPSLIVLDMLMPDVDGFEIARVVRSDPRLSETPIVAVTATQGHDAMFAAGCSAIVEKPFQLEQLVRTLRDVLA